MDILVEILAKTESGKIDSPENNYVLTLKISVEGEPLQFQGQAFIPSVAVDWPTFDNYKVGDMLQGKLGVI